MVKQCPQVQKVQDPNPQEPNSPPQRANAPTGFLPPIGVDYTHSPPSPQGNPIPKSCDLTGLPFLKGTRIPKCLSYDHCDPILPPGEMGQLKWKQGLCRLNKWGKIGEDYVQYRQPSDDIRAMEDEFAAVVMQKKILEQGRALALNEYSPMELVKLVKSNYIHYPVSTITPDYRAKLISRNLLKFGYVTDFSHLDEMRLWSDQYQRKQNMLKAGHHTERYTPYKELGDVTLEPNDLMVKNFGECLPDWVRELKCSNKQVEQTNELERNTRKDSDTKRQKEFLDADISLPLHMGKHDNHTAGMDGIKRLLRESQERMTSTRAGESYLSHVYKCQRHTEHTKREEEKHKDKDTEGRMVVERLSGDTLDHLIPVLHQMPLLTTGKPPDAVSKIEHGTDQEMLIDEQLEGRIQAQICDAKMMKATISKQVGRKLKKINALSKDKRERKFNSAKFVEKVNFIHIILCSLHNIKSRFLKSRHTLTPDVLRSLRRDPFAKKEEERFGRNLPRTSVTDATVLRYDSACSQYVSPRTQTHPSNSLQRGSTNQAGVSSVHYQTPHTPSLMLTHNTASVKIAPLHHPSHHIASQVPGLPSSNRGSERRRTRMLNVSNKDAHSPARVETWEDFLTVGAKTRLVRALRNKPLPWQQTIKETHSNPQQDEAEVYDPAKCLTNIRSEFLTLKKKAQIKSQGELDRIDRDRYSQFKVTLDYIENMLKNHVMLMRTTSSEVIRCPDTVTEETAPWYESLLQEAHYVKIEQDPAVKTALSKLTRFILEDLSALSNIMEKLCLLVMSLPVYEICTAACQQAIMFIMGEMLEMRPQLLPDWLNHRKLFMNKDF